MADVEFRIFIKTIIGLLIYTSIYIGLVYFSFYLGWSFYSGMQEIGYELHDFAQHINPEGIDELDSITYDPSLSGHIFWISTLIFGILVAFFLAFATHILKKTSKGNIRAEVAAICAITIISYVYGVTSSSFSKLLIFLAIYFKLFPIFLSLLFIAFLYIIALKIRK